LKNQFDQETFEKSQRYGKHKAKFTLVQGLFQQTLSSALMHFGVYAWAWQTGGTLIGKLGYAPAQNEVRDACLYFTYYTN
jgi:STE24 endopeptidase